MAKASYHAVSIKESLAPNKGVFLTSWPWIFGSALCVKAYGGFGFLARAIP